MHRIAQYPIRLPSLIGRLPDIRPVIILQLTQGKMCIRDRSYAIGIPEAILLYYTFVEIKKVIIVFGEKNMGNNTD